MNTKQTVFIVDDDEGVRDGLSLLLATVGQPCELYESACDFLDAYDPSRHGCLVLDIRMPRMTGLDLQRRLIDMKARLPIIFITGHGDVPMAVEAMRRGAVDFIRKPFREHDLLDRINEALNLDDDIQKKQASRQQLADKLEALSEREWQVLWGWVTWRMRWSHSWVHWIMAHCRLPLKPCSWHSKRPIVSAARLMNCVQASMFLQIEP